MNNCLSTYFLVSHGSRDPRAKQELQTFAELVSRQIPLSKYFRRHNNILKSPVITTGVLELGLKSLHEQIEDFWEYTRSLHICQIQIIPLFLLPGVHVTEDIPAEIEIFQERLRAIATSEMVLQQQKSNLKLENQLEINTPEVTQKQSLSRKFPDLTDKNQVNQPGFLVDTTPEVTQKPSLSAKFPDLKDKNQVNQPGFLVDTTPEVTQKPSLSAKFSDLKDKNQVNQPGFLVDTPVKINLCPYIGSHPKMVNLLGTKITSVTADAWVIISHGSRRPSGNETVKRISQLLTNSYQVLVCTAYWSVPPDLKSRVEMLAKQGYRKIGILPYFLFHGGIIDAIADTVNQFSQIYPHIKFHLTTPLGATEELAKLVSDVIMRQTQKPGFS